MNNPVPSLLYRKVKRLRVCHPVGLRITTIRSAKQVIILLYFLNGKNLHTFGKYQWRDVYKDALDDISKNIRIMNRPVLQVDENNNVIGEFKSCSEAYEFLTNKRSNGWLENAIRNKRKYKGFYWRYK